MSGWWYQLVILVIGGMWWNLNNMWVVTICYNAFFLILIHTAKVSCLFTGSLFWVPCELPSHWGHSKTVDRVNGSGFERFKPNPRWTKRWTVDHRGPVDVPRPDQAQGGCTWYTGTLVHWYTDVDTLDTQEVSGVHCHLWYTDQALNNLEAQAWNRVQQLDMQTVHGIWPQ